MEPIEQPAMIKHAARSSSLAFKTERKILFRNTYIRIQIGFQGMF
jgi:hypothetical protein